MESDGKGYFAAFAAGAVLTWYVMHEPLNAAPEDYLAKVCSALSWFASAVPDEECWASVRETFEGVDAAVMTCSVAGHDVSRLPESVCVSHRGAFRGRETIALTHLSNVAGSPREAPVAIKF